MITNANGQLAELIKKPYALKKAKSVVLDEIIMKVQGTPDGKFKPMPVERACREAGTTYGDVLTWLNEDIELKERWGEALATVHSLAKMRAEYNVVRALNGELELNDKELTDISMRVLEKTDERYNPTQKTDSRSMNIDFNVSDDELREKLKTLLS